MQQSYGPYTLDLFALASNTECDSHGKPLRSYAPLPNPGCSGVNVFAQTISPSENAYAFPPFVLMVLLTRALPSHYYRSRPSTSSVLVANRKKTKLRAVSRSAPRAYLTPPRLLAVPF